MTSCGSHTKQSHKRIAQMNHTKRSHNGKMMSRQRMEMMNDAFGCSRATQVCMEDLRLVNLTEIRQVKGVNDSRLLVNALDG